MPFFFSFFPHSNKKNVWVQRKTRFSLCPYRLRLLFFARKMSILEKDSSYQSIIQKFNESINHSKRFQFEEKKSQTPIQIVHKFYSNEFYYLAVDLCELNCSAVLSPLEIDCIYSDA